MVSRTITKLVIDKIGARQRRKRRQEIYEELTRHQLSEDELIELWPYVATAVDHGGSGVLFAGAVLGIVPLGIILFGGYVMIRAGTSIGGLVIGLVIVLVGGVILRYSTWRMYEQWRSTRDLIGDLKANPRTVPETDGYTRLVEQTDYKSGKAYPDDAPVTPQDALDELDTDEDLPVSDAAGSG